LARQTSPLDRTIDAMFAVALVGLAWLVVFGHRGVAPCAGFMALAAALRRSVWREGFSLLAPARLQGDFLSQAALAALLFCLWIAASEFWSPTPGAHWLAITVGASVLVAGALAHEALAASAARARRLATWFALAVFAAAAALMFEGLSGGYLRSVTPPDDLSAFRNKDMTSLARGVTAMAPLVFPAAIIIRRQTGSTLIAAAPAIMLAIAAARFSVFANVVALAAGAAAFLIALAQPKATLAAIAALFVAAALLFPVLATSLPFEELLSDGSAPPSWAQRLFIWREAGDRALGSCFPLGCGADYARGWAENASFVTVPNWPVPVSVMPTHPHNVFLQIWLELGLPGLLLFCAAIGLGVASLLRRPIDRPVLSALAAAAAVSFISVMFEASLWQAWRLAVFSIAGFGIAVSYSVNKLKQ
jgi:O-antigen ligase